jgi:hypothetical protein
VIAGQLANAIPGNAIAATPESNKRFMFSP